MAVEDEFEVRFTPGEIAEFQNALEISNKVLEKQNA